MSPKIDIQFEDKVILAINKPARLLVIPDRWNPSKPDLFSILAQIISDHKIYVVHRLDVDPVYGNLPAICLSQLKSIYRLKPDEGERPLLDRLT